MTETFPDNGSELYTCYNHPATEFEIQLQNQKPDQLDVWIEALNNLNVDTTRSSGYVIWRTSQGILPYQGVRIVWRRKSNGK